MDYSNVTGHEKEIEILKRTIKYKNISHSYLFEGEEGIGKKMIAYILSKTLLCKEQGIEPCNRCASCYKFENKNHPDFHIIEPEKGLIRRGEIDNLIREMSTSPFESMKKIFLIDDADLINIEGQNSILKTLEEPPSYVNIILISSNPNKLLPTILSRVQSIKFYPVESEKVVEILLKEYNINKDKARFISEFTKGGIGKSIKLAEKGDFFILREEVIKLAIDLILGDKTKVFNSIELFNKYEEDIHHILDIIIYWFRDIIVYKEIGESSLIINKDKLEELSKQSYMDFNKINDIIERVEETKLNIRRNINQQLAIETMLLSI